MKKYVFVENSNKPTKESYEFIGKKNLSNVCKPCLEIAHKMNYEVYLGINQKNTDKITTNLPFKVNLYESHTYRNILNIKDNYIAYKNLMKLLAKGQFEVIHCNTPIGGMIGRICGKKNKIKKIIYTAHGFHFYKGAPFINNTLYKFAERFMARWTDAIITMNQEDYEAAKKFKLKKGGKVYFIHGVGINVNDYIKKDIDTNKKRKELKLNSKNTILISIGDINSNKNISLLINIIKELNNPNIKCLICGKGPLLEKMRQKTINLGISDQVLFLGYRNDIKELLSISDIYISTSKREGLPRALMEAMAAGIPCVVSKIRGNIDLIDNDKGGYCCDEIADYIYAINNIINNNKIRKKFVDYNNKKIIKYSYENVYRELTKIYKDIGL